MAQSRFRGYRLAVVIALFSSAVLIGAGSSPALGQVTAVSGSAYGFSTNVSLFGGPFGAKGPAPTVTLPAGGSATPVTATAPSETAQYGPALVFSSGQVNLATQGAPGATGSVTTSASVAAINAGPFTADSGSSTCTAKEGSVTGSATFANGQLVTKNDPSTGNPVTTVPIPTNPVVNDKIHGTIDNVGDSFDFVFNEQVTNSDGSLTVNAGHEYLLGPTAKGDLIFGRSICGVTAVPSTTTTTAGTGGTTTTTSGGGATTTTTGATSTTTTAPAVATTTTTTTVTPAAATTTTTLMVSVGGSAYGYYTSVSLFGGAPATRGPTPTVTLPAGGSAAPVTASAASGSATFGPAQIFTSGPIDLSTQGTPSGGTVTTTSRVAGVGPGPFTADLVAATCTANAAGTTGSVSITNGKLVTTTDANGNPATTVPIPANPAPNTSLTGAVTNVGDTFRFVFNEQVLNPNGTLTVNAGHEYLLGPTAKGDLIFGQAVCGRTASTPGSAGPAAAALSAGSSPLARTGSPIRSLMAFALMLLATGLAVTWFTNGGEGEHPPSGRR